jgi:nucleoside 2-deoxyribosyltransferase
MNEIRYETPIEEINFNLPSIFLAGPTVRGHQPHLTSWRLEAIELFKQKNFQGNLIIPEFANPKESDKYRYDVPVWEFRGLTKSDIILIWLPRTRELIGLTTNFEMGYWVARERTKVIYGRPDDAYRITYCDIMWVEDSKIQKADCSIHNTLEKTVNATLEKMEQIKPRGHNSEQPLMVEYGWYDDEIEDQIQEQISRGLSRNDAILQIFRAPTPNLAPPTI